MACREQELQDASLRVLAAGSVRMESALLPPAGTTEEPLTLAAVQVLPVLLFGFPGSHHTACMVLCLCCSTHFNKYNTVVPNQTTRRYADLGQPAA